MVITLADITNWRPTLKNPIKHYTNKLNALARELEEMRKSGKNIEQEQLQTIIVQKEIYSELLGYTTVVSDEE